MSQWKKVKIGDFLTEREGRYKPDDKEISKHKRLEKIDFSGTIHISDKPTKTDMIIVHPGDLVISGINVAKGAVAVYQGDEPVCATIHYSSYTFDSSKVDLDYFKYFVKSPAFIAALQKQVKGGIKTEIKPRHLLPLEISIPDLQTQQEIVKKISSQLQKTEQLSFEIESQKNYIKQLRQNILQEAIEGKLTEDWRKQNPVQKGNPDYDAEALFKKIQEERNKGKKQKELSPITDEEKPFEIPKGWEWVRLESLSSDILYGVSESAKENGKYKLLRITDIQNNFVDWDTVPYTDFNDAKVNQYLLHKGDILFARTGGTVGKSYLVEQCPLNTIYASYLIRVRLTEYVNSHFIKSFFESPFYWRQITDSLVGTGQPNCNGQKLANLALPLPPLKEQEEIVTKVESLLAKVTELENQIQERKSLSDKLIFGVIKENLEVN